jgi:hypothetical protein
MATKVYDTVVVELQDGQEVEIKPLPIKRLRRFMKAIEQLANGDSDREQVDVLLDAVAIVLEKKYPNIANDRDLLEDLVDVPTMNKILEVAGGLDMSGEPNPNQASPLGTP